MARRSRYTGYQNAMKTMRSAPEAVKRGSGHELIHQHLLRLKTKEKTTEKQEVGGHE